MSGALAGTEICVFDAYGTLFDFNSAVARHRGAIGPKADALSDMWRSKQIQYTWLRNSMGAYAKFWQVTGEALDHCLAASRHRGPGRPRETAERLPGARSLSRSAGDARQAEDAPGCGSPSCPTAIPRCSTRWSRRRSLADRFEAVLSVDDAKVFKVDPKVYRLVEARCGVKPDKVCFLSSNCWDAHGAAHFGFSTAMGEPRRRARRQPARHARGARSAISPTSLPCLVFPDVLAPTFADVQAAARRLDGVTFRTPLLENARVNAQLGGRLFIKAECLQRTGSFKLRGAYNFLAR